MWSEACVNLHSMIAEILLTLLHVETDHTLIVLKLILVAVNQCLVKVKYQCRQVICRRRQHVVRLWGNFYVLLTEDPNFGETTSLI